MILLLLLLVSSCFSQITPLQRDIFLDQHNIVRLAASPQSKYMPAMYWSDALQNSAQSWSNRCVFAHSGTQGVGENLYAFSPQVPLSQFDVSLAVKAWASEKPYYNYANNTCTGVCGHYTQLVWSTSDQVGCSLSSCNAIQNWQNRPGMIIVCQYIKQGNWIGQRPYSQLILSNNWQVFPGSLRQISAKGAYVVGTTSNNIPYVLQGNTWTQLPGQCRVLSASNDGYFFCVGLLNRVARWTPNVGWVHIPSPLMRHIDSMNQGRAVAVGLDGRVYAYNLQQNTWFWLLNLNATKAIVGVNGFIAAIGTDSQLYRWGPGKFVAMGGTGLRDISMHTLGEFTMVDTLNRGYRWINNGWVLMNTNVLNLVASNNRMWITTTSNTILTTPTY